MADGGSKVRRTQRQWISGAVDFYIFHIEGVPVDNHHFSKSTRSWMTNILLDRQQPDLLNSGSAGCSGRLRHILRFISRTRHRFTRQPGFICSRASHVKKKKKALRFHSFPGVNEVIDKQQPRAAGAIPVHLFALDMHDIAPEQFTS